MNQEALSKIEEIAEHYRAKAKQFSAALEAFELAPPSDAPLSNILADDSVIDEIKTGKQKHQKIANKLRDAIAIVQECEKMERGETEAGGMDPIIPTHFGFQDTSLGDACERILHNNRFSCGFTKEEFFRRIRKGHGDIIDPKSLAPILSKDSRFVPIGRGRWTTKDRINEMEEMISNGKKKIN